MLEMNVKIKNIRRIFIRLFILLIILLSTTSIGDFLVVNTDKINHKSISSQTRTDAWIVDLQANFNNAYWFFENLNDNDRLMIRKAFEYVMPKKTICKSIMDGFAQPLTTFASSEQGIFSFADYLPIYSYNVSKAKEILTKVFGYEYSIIDDSSTPYNESKFYFPINLLASDSDSIQLIWANLINGIFNYIGVKSVIIQESSSDILQRIFNSPSTLGFDYDHGGFDGLFKVDATNFLPDDGDYHFGSSNIPYLNYQNVIDPVIDYLIEQENNKSISASQRLSYFYQMQQYVQNQSLKYYLFENLLPFVYSKYLEGFNPFFESGLLPYQNLSFSNGKNSLTIAVGSKYSKLMPLLAGDSASNYVSHGLWAGGLLAFSTPNNDSSFTNYQTYNNIASSYTISPDQLFYNFTIRHGIKWADGTELTASDVAFTYESIMSSTRNTLDRGLLLYYMMNINSIKVYDDYHIGFQFIRWVDPFPFGENLFKYTIIPKSTYSVPDWDHADFTTGNNINSSNYASKINGNGPYQINSINTSTGEVNLTVNPLWLNSTYANQFSVPGYNVTPSINSIKISVLNVASSAVNSLLSGEVDFIDKNMYLPSVYSSLIFSNVNDGSIKVYNASAHSIRELGLNQASSIWGYSPVKPSWITTIKTNITTPTTSIQTETTNTGNLISSPSIDLLLSVLIIFLAFFVISFVIYTTILGKRSRNENKKYLNNKQKSITSNEAFTDDYIDSNVRSVILCPYCGLEIKKEDLFCANCGNRL